MSRSARSRRLNHLSKSPKINCLPWSRTRQGCSLNLKRDNHHKIQHCAIIFFRCPSRNIQAVISFKELNLGDFSSQITKKRLAQKHTHKLKNWTRTQYNSSRHLKVSVQRLTKPVKWRPSMTNRNRQSQTASLHSIVNQTCRTWLKSNQILARCVRCPWTNARLRITFNLNFTIKVRSRIVATTVLQVLRKLKRISPLCSSVERAVESSCKRLSKRNSEMGSSRRLTRLLVTKSSHWSRWIWTRFSRRIICGMQATKTSSNRLGMLEHRQIKAPNKLTKTNWSATVNNLKSLRNGSWNLRSLVRINTRWWSWSATVTTSAWLLQPLKTIWQQPQLARHCERTTKIERNLL